MPLPVIAKVAAEFADNAAFLWLLRDRAVAAPHYDLDDLSGLDDRLEAHLDGLRVSGHTAWNLCRQALEDHPEPGETFAATVLAFEGADERRLEGVLAIASPKPDLHRAPTSPLGWLPMSTILERVPPMFRAADA